MPVNIVAEHQLEITTVGIDIGSATMSVAFSKITLEKFGHRYVVVDRQAMNSPTPALTPYRDDVTIDSSQVTDFVSDQFTAAGLRPAEVEGGVTILTGTALLRTNARAVADAVATAAGNLVVVSAGDRLEGWLAAQGSGAVQLSSTLGEAVLNVDIGGGTTKLTGAREGEVSWTLALDIGARLIAVDEEFTVRRLEPAGERAAQEVGLTLKTGQVTSESELRLVADRLTQELCLALPTTGGVPEDSAYFRAGDSDGDTEYSAIVFSGGVSEFLHGRETESFGDLGLYISDALRDRIAGAGVGAAVQTDVGMLSATVLGASQFTVQVSGNTVYVSHPEVLPIRNVPVVSISDVVTEHLPELERLTELVEQRISAIGVVGDGNPLALSLSLPGPPTRQRINLLADALKGAILGKSLSALVLVSEDDLGRTLGSKVASRVGGLPVVSVDGVEVSTMDFVDVGRPIDSTASLPVVVKSLVFASPT